MVVSIASQTFQNLRNPLNKVLGNLFVGVQGQLQGTLALSGLHNARAHMHRHTHVQTSHAFKINEQFFQCWV